MLAFRRHFYPAEAALLGEIQGCQGSFCEELSGPGPLLLCCLEKAVFDELDWRLKLVFKQEKEKGELVPGACVGCLVPCESNERWWKFMCVRLRLSCSS